MSLSLNSLGKTRSLASSSTVDPVAPSPPPPPAAPAGAAIASRFSDFHFLKSIETPQLAAVCYVDAFCCQLNPVFRVEIETESAHAQPEVDSPKSERKIGFAISYNRHCVQRMHLAPLYLQNRLRSDMTCNDCPFPVRAVSSPQIIISIAKKCNAERGRRFGLCRGNCFAIECQHSRVHK